MTSTQRWMTGSYDYVLVALSVAIAIFASHTALDLAGRVTAASGWARRVWLGGGAAALGFGIWSMHYIGMLAFRLPWRSAPDIFLTAVDREAFLTALRNHKVLSNFEHCLRRAHNVPGWVLENATLVEGNEDAPAMIE